MVWPPITLHFSGTPQGFGHGFISLRAALDGEEPRLNSRTSYHIELVFEEIVGNMVRYGAPQGGELCVQVSVEMSADRILLTFEDDGIPFDPCSRSDAAPLRTQQMHPMAVSA
jgi:two-component sensor histidine kinase